MSTVYFDSILRTKSGKHIPFYDVSYDVKNISDKKLVWFHESYGRMGLYRTHQIDDTDEFIAEPLRKYARTSDPDWGRLLEHPEDIFQEKEERI